jgi:release factor glutamine methyltransferase
MDENLSIKKTISYIKTELKDLYPLNEINSFINLIFDKFLNYSSTKLHISQEQEMSEDLFKEIVAVCEELKLQKPIQYILEEAHFYDLKFKVAPGVLIPRQETEELVDWVIKEESNKKIKILDIGTGSGCIAITLAKNLPEATLFASDVSSKALEIAKHNSESNNIDLHFLQFDILNPSLWSDETFDIIVSNPPYVTEKEKNLMQKNVLDFEPELALFVPDNSPLKFYDKIIDFGKKHLNPNGRIYFEINEAFGKETALLFNKNIFTDISLRKDLNGKDRMLRGIKRLEIT